MIAESLKLALNSKDSKLDFKRLLAFMEDSGINFEDRQLKHRVLGMASADAIYINSKALNEYDNRMSYFVILHEMAHYKRIQRLGRKSLIAKLSDDNFETFCQHIIEEEIFADRYASVIFHLFNQKIFPSYMTQELHLDYRKFQYEAVAKQFFGVIKHKEENYKELLNSFLV